MEPLPPLAGDPSLPRAHQQLTAVWGSPAGRSGGRAPSQWPCGEPQRALDSVTVLGPGLGFLACLLMALVRHKDSWSLLICKAEDEHHLKMLIPGLALGAVEDQNSFSHFTFYCLHHAWH